ncbi:MAG: ChaN family lipoprotein [Alphaproteobacteria bacterium]|nr:ChaN family lipoprotein [Alphaproteobacteria bacterium]
MIPALLAAAVAHECDEVALDELTSVEAPAVVVLGERHGARDDMKRALAVVEALRARGPVRLAMEAVHESNQGVLDAYAKGELKTGHLPRELRWDETWGYAWKPYKKLVTASRSGVQVVAAGLDLGPKPADREVEIPDGYDAFLKEAIGGHAHQMSEEVRARFATSMAWRDFRIGELAAEGWDGQGFLVLLTGRGHVEGGLGTTWQLPKLVEAPVTSVVLDHDGARCHPGDRVWAH